MTNLELLVENFFESHFSERMVSGGIAVRQIKFIMDNYLLEKDFPLLKGKTDDYFEIVYTRHKSEHRLTVIGQPKPKFIEDMELLYPEKLI